MKVRVVYRSHAGGNLKDRPDFYDKRRALLSLLRAAEVAGCETLFLNDGPPPAECADLMRDAGETVTLPGVGMRRSFLAGLTLPAERGWAPDDLVYLCEDDYLHVPDALVRLRAAAEATSADYLTLYGIDPEAPPSGQWDHEARDGEPYLPPRWDPVPSTEIDGVRWSQVPASTSTFAFRVAALDEDLGIFRQAGWPHRTMYRDKDMCLTYQGYRSHRWSDLGRDVLLRSGGDVRSRVRAAVLAPFKAGMNVRARRRPDRRRVLLAPFPNLATHLESAFLAPGRDWAAVARDVEGRAGTEN